MKVIEEEGLKDRLKGSPGCGVVEEGCVYVDKDLPGGEKRLVVIHEVLDIWLHGRVRHSNIDKIAIDVIDCLQQIGELE